VVGERLGLAVQVERPAVDDGLQPGHDVDLRVMEG
jgi:hypothetical protein